MKDQVQRALADLVTHPTTGDIRKLQGYSDLYRLRVGDDRVLFSRLPDQRIVVIDRVVPRGKAYR